jgi:hypothetical protein
VIQNLVHQHKKKKPDINISSFFHYISVGTFVSLNNHQLAASFHPLADHGHISLLLPEKNQCRVSLANDSAIPPSP